MVKKFVPRQRKQKALARERAQENGTHPDSNVEEIIPLGKSELEEKKSQLKKELRQDGVKISGKKAKRLEKYIENKLKKDENRELLAKLAANKIDTSLFASSRSLGQTKETKREAFSRALREQQAGLPNDASRDEVLYERRRDAGAESSEDDGEEGVRPGKSLDSRNLRRTEPEAATALPTTSQAMNTTGSGLKRPLEKDDEGRPILAKRRKRGGVRSKVSLAQPEHVAPEAPESDEWSGLSSDEESDIGLDSPSEVHSEAQSSDASEAEGDNSDESNEDEEGSEIDESEADSEQDDDSTRRERSSAFKAWANQQRNEALGYDPVESEPTILDIPRPANFKPRSLEQDPLPLELQVTTNTSRKVFSVTVARDPDIQEARLKLPVVADEQKIMEAIHNHDIVVVCGATGSGKTTQVPQFLFEAGYGSPDSPTPGMVGVTQPRRVAAVSMAKRVGQELGDHSHTVAYQIRFEGTVDPNTAIKFMTDGVLLREVAQDIALWKYSAIIVDEAHERSVNTDILVGMLSRVIKLRADLAKEDPTVKPLKLIIMSATLRIQDLTMNSVLFPNPPPVIEVEGRQYPVTVHFARKTNHDYVEEAFRKISRGHKKLPPGGFLVFLTGQNEITQLSKRLRSAFGGLSSATSGAKVRISASEAPIEAEDIDFGEVDDRNANDMDDDMLVDQYEDDEDEDEDADFDIEDEEAGTGPLKMQILPLYSLLPTKDQMKVFEPPPESSRQVILATNVAETSLTIPGIRYVFDCGRSKERRFDRLSGVQSFEIGWISKASANQRSGRAGRTGPGHCYRLYSSAVYERDFPEFADPELLRMPIEGVVLQLKAMNLQHVVNFPFPTPPDRRSLAKAEKLLAYLSAVSAGGQVTQIGSTMSIFPISPRFARILLVGHLHDCLPYTIALVAGLSAPEVFIPESQAIPAIATQTGDDSIRTNDDVLAENRQASARRAYNSVHKNFCFLDDKSDAIKLLQVVGEFAHEPTEEWCRSHFVRFKMLKEIQQLRHQLVDLLRTNIPGFANLRVEDRLDPPTPKQVQALKQMVAAGFIDQVAIRADKSPNPPEAYRKPRRAIDVPYLPLMPLDDGGDVADRMVVSECPEYVVYSHLQRAGNVLVGEKRPKTRMHALTDVTGGQLASLARGTPLVSYGKPIKEVRAESEAEGGGGRTREVWAVPYLRAEATGGMGWPLPARKVTQRKVAGKGWVVE
ncbi:RNA helicase-like protein [Phialemonium atrogriseum]|uniref:RNA helicase n=1 Tax=Phialemonium atrogriseum TaxID=1093897 RepID=A0AAJ0BZ90_9PEZI|nr:RNA helicase-like protein [Phialemonium atrogriseum]KAK1766158.1 RNA helicase-like protein [Phialemonium atrogriseum]